MHCYTFNPDYQVIGEESISEIVKSLEGKNPGVIYISGHNENFYNPNKGLELSESLFDTYHCDLLITTRNVFGEKEIERLSRLNDKMNLEGKNLFFCISIPALDSYKKLENSPVIPTPQERIKFLSEVYSKKITTFLTIKPLCPSEFIPVDEALEIIEKCKDYSTVVLSSGIVVDNYILKRLKGFPLQFDYEQGPLMKCLENDLDVKYVDVCKELEKIKASCEKNDLPFFEHSMPAIQYVKKKNIC